MKFPSSFFNNFNLSLKSCSKNPTLFGPYEIVNISKFYDEIQWNIELLLSQIKLLK